MNDWTGFEDVGAHYTRLESRPSIGAKPSGRPSKRGARSSEASSEDGPQSTLPLYLREMGSIPLLRDTDEVRLARDLFEARDALVKIMRRLPSGVRAGMLDSEVDVDGDPQVISTDRIVDFFSRLERAPRESQSSTVRDLVRRGRSHRLKLERARDAMIVANLRLVVHIAKKFTNSGMAFTDLIQEGNLGLLRAVEKFDHRRGNRFSTYAYWWIKQAIDRAIADKARLIRIPVHLNDKRKQFARAVKELRQELDRRPTPEEIATRLEMPFEKIQEVLDVGQEPQSLESLRDSDDGYDLLQIIENPNSGAPDEQSENREMQRSIARSLSKLPEREEEIVRLRFGIGRDRAHTLEEIGRQVNLSRERVRQLEAIAFDKLRASGDLDVLLQGNRGELERDAETAETLA